MMRLEAVIGRLAVSLLLLAHSIAAEADSKAAVPLALDAVSFKENGRFHDKIVAECRIEQDLRKAVEDVNQGLRRKVSRRSTPPEPIHVALRIDKVGHLGSLGQAGTELGVTAISAGHDKGRLFLCHDRPPLRPTHCQRVTHCARKIAEDVVTWANTKAALATP